MFPIQLLLLSHKLQCMIITIQYKFLWDQVMPPLFQCLYDSIKFFVVCGVFQLCLIQLLTEICNWSVLLTQDRSYGKATCITFHLECLLKIWQHQHWLLCDLSLQQIESLLSLGCPMKSLMLLLHYVHHCCTNSTEIPNELSVETSQTMETSQIKNISL
jgi:hypothetical protein